MSSTSPTHRFAYLHREKWIHNYTLWILVHRHRSYSGHTSVASVQITALNSMHTYLQTMDRLFVTRFPSTSKYPRWKFPQRRIRKNTSTKIVMARRIFLSCFSRSVRVGFPEAKAISKEAREQEMTVSMR